MSRTILGDVDGFTPVIDDLVAEFDYFTALVFGKVWRYCQMEQGECCAAINTMADALGISRNTVKRRLETLVEKGYLEKIEGYLGDTNIYRDTGKAGLHFGLVAKSSKGGDGPQGTRGVTHAGPGDGPQGTTKIVIKKEEKKENSEQPPAPLVYPTAKENHGQELAEEERQRIIKSMQKSAPIMDYTGMNVLDLSKYPEEVHRVIGYFCRLWKLRPPQIKGQTGLWITGARELLDACGEFGPEPLKRVYNEYAEAMDKNGGVPRYVISHPRAAVNMVRSMAGRMRGEKEEENKPFDPRDGEVGVEIEDDRYDIHPRRR